MAFIAKLKGRLISMFRAMTLSGRRDPWNSYVGILSEVVLDGKNYYTSTGAAWSLTRPPTGAKLFRFELRPGDVGWTGDPANNRERAEIIAQRTVHKIPFETEFWQSWAFRTETPQNAICNQYHSYDIGEQARTNNLGFYLTARDFKIKTTSDAALAGDGDGIPVTRYTSAALAQNTWIHFVVRVIFGALGELQVWKDGVEILNLTATPIGYYGDANGPYLQFGIYRDAAAATAIASYANMEWGTASLSGRVTNPRSIPA